MLLVLHTFCIKKAVEYAFYTLLFRFGLAWTGLNIDPSALVRQKSSK